MRCSIETDSGLDIDALKIVAHGVNSLQPDSASSFLITHYQRLLNYIVPDHVHVMVHGRIELSGGKELTLQLGKGLRLEHRKTRASPHSPEERITAMVKENKTLDIERNLGNFSYPETHTHDPGSA